MNSEQSPYIIHPPLIDNPLNPIKRVTVNKPVLIPELAPKPPAPTAKLSSNPLQSKAVVKKESDFTVVLAICLFVIPIIIGIIWGTVGSKSKEVTTPKTTTTKVSAPTITSPRQEVYEDNSMTRAMHLPTYNSASTPVEAPPQTANTSEVCNLEIINSYVGTDKIQKGGISINEADSTLTFKGIEHPGEDFTMTYGKGGQCLMKIYINGHLEAEKVVYRRSDLETGDGSLVYTSRTGEIRMIFSY